MDQFYKIREGDAQAVPWKLKSFKFATAAAHGHH